jgi:hypothetical protein
MMALRKLGPENWQRKGRLCERFLGDTRCTTGPPVASIRMRRQDKTREICADNVCTILYQ